MALTIKSNSSAESSSFGILSKVSDTGAPETDPSHFEGLPPEIRNMNYDFLLPPARSRKKCRKSFDEPGCRYGCVLHTANHAILSANRKVRQEASAIFYRKVLLVSIEWNRCARQELNGFTMPHNVAYKFIQKEAVLPPCVVHVQQSYHCRTDYATRNIMIVAAADFPEICHRQHFYMLHLGMDIEGTSYFVTGVPKVNRSMDQLTKLIWSPLLTLQKTRLIYNGGKVGHMIWAVDCTGIFKQSAALSDWDVETNGGHGMAWEDSGEDTDSNACGSDRETSSEENNHGEDSSDGDVEEDDSDEAESNRDKSDQGGDGDEDSNHPGGKENDDPEEIRTEI